MIFPSLKRLRPLWFALGGLAFAIWLTVFLNDAKRPLVPQERADRLAAENYLAGSLTATVPPSPAHWAQLLVWQDPQSGARYPVARQASALAIAACGGNNVAASALAFAAAAAGLAWLLGRSASLGDGHMTLLVAMTLTGVAHGRAWQMHDPFPYLVLAAATFALGAWLQLRDTPTKAKSRLLALSFVGLVLCHEAFGILFGLVVALDLFIGRGEAPAGARSLQRLRPLGTSLLVMVVLLASFGVRNYLVVGDALQTPSGDYSDRNVTAPDWFWKSLIAPPAKLDPVFERYDELVALPNAHWANPVYRSWFERVYEGTFYAGGLALALAALAAALILPGRVTRPPVLLVLGLIAISFLRYSYSSSWWPLATPALLLLAALGLAHLVNATSPKWAGKLLAAIALLQLATLPTAPQAKPTPAEYGFATRLKEVAEKVAEKPGPHLIFVRFDDGADGRIEPADLGRDWNSKPLLFARDLGSEPNAALAAEMAGRTPWRIIIFKDRIGLQPWTKTLDTKPPAQPVPSVAPVPTPAS
jgi:hypothetical protein